MLMLLRLLLVLAAAAAAHAQRTGFSGNTCPDFCPATRGQPVCGTNNILYKSECHLQLAACNSNIRKKHDGPCITSTKSDCEKRCSTSYQPVCGTNGRTYDNRCKLSIATCTDSNIRERYEGVCDISSGSPPSNSAPSVGTLSARPSGQSSSSSGSSSSSSSSSNVQSGIGGLVIGAPVRPIFPAATQSSQPAGQLPVVPAPAPVAPVVVTARPVRNCRDDCTSGFRPVCGSDGQVYGNECKLRVAICKNPSLKKRNDGVCEKDCTIQCPLEINSVCGNNGQTYVNECDLIVAQCKDPFIQKVSDGPCNANIRNTECLKNCERNYNPVCGSDGKTYENICLLMNQSCRNTALLRLHDGECQVQRCDDVCPSVLRPVCGSDGVTYPNECTLINETCKARSSVKKAGDGPCRRRLF